MSGGEGAGKSFLAGLWATINLTYLAVKYGYRQTQGTPQAVADLCWVVGLTYTDAYKDWDYIYKFCEALDNVEPGTYHVRDGGKDQCTFRTKSGQLVATISGEDPTNVGRENVHILLGAEASRWSAELFHRAHGRIERTASLGSAMFLSGSFESSVGPFADWFKLGQGPNAENVVSHTVPTWANRKLYPGGIDDPAIQRLRARNSESRFWERYGGRPAAPKNIVLPDFNSVLHVDPRLSWSDSADTYIGVDPGSICYAYVVWQYHNDLGEVHVMDEGYIHRGTHESVATAAKTSMGWSHLLRTRRGFIDIAGYQDHANPEAAAKIWERMTGFWFSGERFKVEATIDRIRSFLMVNPQTGRPRMRIHPRCKGLRAELGDGPNPIEGRGMWLRYNEHGKPREDSCDAVKALGYSLAGVFGTDMPSNEYALTEDTSYVMPVNRLRKPTAIGPGWKIV